MGGGLHSLCVDVQMEGEKRQERTVLVKTVLFTSAAKDLTQNFTLCSKT